MTNASTPVPLPQAYRLLNHGPVVLLSTTDGAHPNAAPVAWCATLRRDPPQVMLALGRGHKTFGNIAATGEVVINLPPVSMVEAVRICGTRSGHETPDKLQQAGLELMPATTISAPRIAGCLAWLECRVVSLHQHEDHLPLIVEVVAATAVEGLLDDQVHVRVDQYPSLHHLGGKRFAVAQHTVTTDN